MIPFFIPSSGLDPAFKAYLNRRTVLPTGTDYDALHALFKGLRADGTLTGLDVLILPLANHRQDNLLNLVSSNWNAREIWADGCVSGWTNGATHLYETFTPSGVTQVTASNTSGNGSFYSNNLGAVTTGSRLRFTYTLTMISGATPGWNLRTAAGGYSAGGSLSATYTALLPGTNTIDITPTGTSASAFFNILNNNGNSSFVISNMKLEYITQYNASGLVGNTGNSYYCWGSNFIPTAEPASKFVSGAFSCFGMTPSTTYTTYTQQDMGSSQTSKLTRLMARNSSGQASGYSQNGAQALLSFTGTEGLLSVTRANAGNVSTAIYSRGTLLGVGAQTTAHSHTDWELYYGAANDNGTGLPAPGPNRTASGYYIGADITPGLLDSRLNTYLTTKGLGY